MEHITLGYGDSHYHRVILSTRAYAPPRKRSSMKRLTATPGVTDGAPISTADRGPAQGPAVWKTAMAGGAGSVIEYYDFSPYANLAIYISAAFLSRSDPGTALLETLAVFGSGFLMRPVGALFFGWL